jgi:hypothetical protein
VQRCRLQIACENGFGAQGALEGFMGKRKVLVACPPFALATVERALSSHADLICVNTLATARAQLAAHLDIAMVVCGVHFDESRMFDLLEYARRERVHVPFVCVRVLDVEAPRTPAESIHVATKALGAVDYVDVVAMVREQGRDAAESRLAARLRKHLKE